MEYRTSDTNELAPYPDMTSEELRDFEAYASDVDSRGTGGAYLTLAVLCIALVLAVYGSVV